MILMLANAEKQKNKENCLQFQKQCTTDTFYQSLYRLFIEWLGVKCTSNINVICCVYAQSESAGVSWAS